ncbi:MAG: capsule assembly Wzi family protein [Treponema sp.]|nr:capsule assembly Wzi family protein [Treponema sp.]
MKKYLFFLIILLILSVNLYANPFDMILTGDPVLDDLRYLSIESGKTFLSFTPPLAPGEIRNFLDSIDESTLSDPAREIYYRLLNRLTLKAPFLSLSDNIFSGFLNINAELEGRLSVNPDISWHPDNSLYAPLLSFSLKLFFTDFLQLYIEPKIAVKPRDGGIGFTNIPLDQSSQYWPLRSFISMGGSWWNFHLGRDHLYWGTAHTGSLSFSNNSIYYDFARVSFFSPTIKYSLIVNQMPLNLDHESNIQLIKNPEEWDILPEDKRTTNRYFYLHRIDINLFNKVSIGIMEGVLVGNSPLEIRFLNPLMLFHSLYSWEDYIEWKPALDKNVYGSLVGSFFSVEINYNIIKRLSVYGQFVMNEIALPSELKAGLQPPNGLGYMAGINYTFTFNKWLSIFYLEFFYTDPYLYILSSPFSSFIHQNWDYYLIGHSRDTISFSLGSDFFYNDTLKLTGNFSWIISGEKNKDGLLWDWEKSYTAFNERTPTGTAENKFVLSACALWKPYSFLTLKANITGIISLNNNYIPGEIQTGAQTQFSISFNY